MTTSTPERNIKKALDLIQGFEGLSGLRDDGKFYPKQEAADNPGVLTIGKGHVVKAHELKKFNKGLTRGEVEKLFAADIAPRVNRLAKLIPPWSTPDQFCALLSLFYNNEDAIHKTPGKLHKAKDEIGCAAAMLMYVISRKKPQKGLWRRRMAEAWLYLTGEVVICNSPDKQLQLFKQLSAMGVIQRLKQLKPTHPFLRN